MKLKDYESAYKFLLQQKKYDDSLRSISLLKANEELVTRFETEEKEEKIDELLAAQRKKDLEIRRQSDILNYIYIIGLLITCIIVLSFLYYNFRQSLKLKADFSKQFIERQELQYQRVSSELHDNVGQHMAFLKNQLIKNNQPQLVSSTEEAIDALRDLSKELYPNQLEKYGLEASVNNLVEKLRQSSLMFVSCDIQSHEKISGETALNLYRIIQECTTNCIKHSSAKAMRITGFIDKNRYIVSVQDDGIGFDKNSIEKRPFQSFGLLNIQERVKLLGGKMELETQTDEGCKFTFIIPLT